MTTATTKAKPAKSVSAELEALTDARWKAHTQVRALNEQAKRYDAETEQLRAEYGEHHKKHPEQFEGGDQRAKQGTAAARLRDQIRERMEGENPHGQALDKATAAYRDADTALRTFKRDRCSDLIAEATEGHDALVDALAETKAREVELLRGFLNEAGAVRDIVVDTDELARRRHVWDQDPRLHDWLNAALAMRDGDAPSRPGLTDFGVYTLESHGG